MIGAALIAGVPVDDVTIEEAVALIDTFVEQGRATGRTFQVATVNVDFVVNALADPEVLGILQRAELCLADGMPILWHAALSRTRLRERVAGADLVPRLVERSRTTGSRVLLFGSAPGVAESAAEHLAGESPGSIVHGLSGPFLTDVRDLDQHWVDEITALRPDIICVALGNPKQERFIEAHRHRLGASVLIGVGGTLDFIVGGRRRAPEIMQRTGLEWVYRAAQEPQRLGRRYAHDLVAFAPHMARALRHRAGSGRVAGDRQGAVADQSVVAQTVAMARDARRAGSAPSLDGSTPTTLAALREIGLVEAFRVAGRIPRELSEE